MMRNLYRTSPFLCLFTILVLYVIPTLVNSRKLTIDIITIDLITSTCKQTTDPKLCETILESDPRSFNAANVRELLLIMIDYVKIGFSDSLRYVEDLIQKTQDADTLRGLQECKWVYQVVVETSVDLAVTSVKQGVPKFGAQAMSDASVEAEVCLMAFPETKVPEQIISWTPKLQGVSKVAASMFKILD